MIRLSNLKIEISKKEIAMSIGYACLAVGVPNTLFKSCMLKNVSEDRLEELIENNLNALENIIDYNRFNIKFCGSLAIA
jgi:hypothetical protein